MKPTGRTDPQCILRAPDANSCKWLGSGLCICVTRQTYPTHYYPGRQPNVCPYPERWTWSMFLNLPWVSAIAATASEQLSLWHAAPAPRPRGVNRQSRWPVRDSSRSVSPVYLPPKSSRIEGSWQKHVSFVLLQQTLSFACRTSRDSLPRVSTSWDSPASAAVRHLQLMSTSTPLPL